MEQETEMFSARFECTSRPLSLRRRPQTVEMSILVIYTRPPQEGKPLEFVGFQEALRALRRG